MKPPVSQPYLQRHLLSDIPAITPEFVQKLKSQWIESAEEALAIALASGGTDGLKNLLGINDEEIKRLIRMLIDVVGEETARGIQQGGQSRGALGALLTDEQKRRFAQCGNPPKEGGVA